MNRPDAAEERPDGVRDGQGAGNMASQTGGEGREPGRGDDEATIRNARHDGAGDGDAAADDRDAAADERDEAVCRDDRGAGEDPAHTNGQGSSADLDGPRAVTERTPATAVPDITERQLPEDDASAINDPLPGAAAEPPPDDDYPEVTDRLPEDARFLEVTDYPTGTANLEVNDLPEVASVPGVTVVPAAANVPEVSDLSAAANVPEVTDLSAAASVPEVTDLSAAASVPEVTHVPAATDTGDGTDIPAAAADSSTGEAGDLRVQPATPSGDTGIPLSDEAGGQSATDGAEAVQTAADRPVPTAAARDADRREAGPQDAQNQERGQDEDRDQDQAQGQDQDRDQGQDRDRDRDRGEYPDQGPSTIPAFGLIATLDFSGDSSAQRQPSADDPIPMLTEVVQVPRYEPEDLPHSLADVDWSDLAQRVRENALERLLRRSDTLLEAQFTATLQPVVERAIETLTLEVHDALNRMIRDIVARAVTEELTRLHAEIASRNTSPHRQPAP
jgi:hypothetical protein